jgi:hypothetical protein
MSTEPKPYEEPQVEEIDVEGPISSAPIISGQPG